MKQTKRYDVCVVGGLGHVGLPFGIALANGGLDVVLLDKNEEAMETVAKGEVPFLEVGAKPMLQKVLDKKLFLSNRQQDILQSRFIVIVIGTPADRHLNPEFDLFKKLLDDILGFLHDDQHIILRSTVFPGTTEKTKQYLENKGIQAKVSFCPERISQGRALEELNHLPQIIGCFDEEASKEARELFSHVVSEIIPLSPIEAELAKIYTNVWRYIEFAIANQFYQIATENDLDFYKIHNAIVTNYPRAANYKRAGFTAGPCLFKDTAHMNAYTGNTFFLGNAALMVNEGLPNFIVQRLRKKYPIMEKTIGILGMAFKPNIDDKRDSLSFKLKKILDIESKKVLCSDVYIQHEGFVTPGELIRNSDIIVLGTPHNEYRSIKIPKDKVLVDIWNFFGHGGLF